MTSKIYIRFNNNHPIHIHDFPELVEKHLWNCGGTDLLENEGNRLRTVQVTDFDLRNFILCVCMWGGANFTANKIYEPGHNTLNELRTQFCTAIKIMNSSPNKVGDALKALNKVRYLGGVSVASKHLRLLYPEFCPVLDGRIATECQYSEDSSGYEAYAADCIKAARDLENSQITNPRKRPFAKWYAGDIDMALYASVQKWEKPL